MFVCEISFLIEVVCVLSLESSELSWYTKAIVALMMHSVSYFMVWSLNNLWCMCVVRDHW